MDKGLELFLYEHLSVKKGRKPKCFYTDLIYYQKLYPNVVNELIRNLYKLGNWKDYFHILKYIDNTDNKENNKLNDIIFELLIESIQDDNLKVDVALAMPREGSYIDKQTQFVDRFSKMFFPKNNKITNRKVYRQYMSNLCKSVRKVNVKTVDEITSLKVDVSTVKTHCLVKFLDQDVKLVKDELFNRYSQLDFWMFCNYCLSNDNANNNTKDVIQQVFNANIEKFKETIESLNLYHPYFTIQVDLSLESCVENNLNYIIGVILVNVHNVSSPQVIVNCKEFWPINLANKTLFEKIETIKNSLEPSKQIWFRKDKSNETTFIITAKSLPKQLEYDNVILWQLVSDFKSTSNNNNIIRYKPSNKVSNVELLKQLIGGYSYVKTVYYPVVKNSLLNMFIGTLGYIALQVSNHI